MLYPLDVIVFSHGRINISVVARRDSFVQPSIPISFDIASDPSEDNSVHEVDDPSPAHEVVEISNSDGDIAADDND